MPSHFGNTISIEKHKSSYDINVFGEGILHQVFVENLQILTALRPPSRDHWVVGAPSQQPPHGALSSLDVRDRLYAKNRISCAVTADRSSLRSKLDFFSNLQPMVRPGTHANELIPASHAN